MNLPIKAGNGLHQSLLYSHIYMENSPLSCYNDFYLVSVYRLFKEFSKAWNQFHQLIDSI